MTGGTISWLELHGGRTMPDHVLRQRLTAVEGKIHLDVPLLSALVTGPDDGPVPFFR